MISSLPASAFFGCPSGAEDRLPPPRHCLCRLCFCYFLYCNGTDVIINVIVVVIRFLSNRLHLHRHRHTKHPNYHKYHNHNQQEHRIISFFFLYFLGM
jgi:hypothetical protein